MDWGLLLDDFFKVIVAVAALWGAWRSQQTHGLVNGQHSRLVEEGERKDTTIAALSGVIANGQPAVVVATPPAESPASAPVAVVVPHPDAHPDWPPPPPPDAPA